MRISDVQGSLTGTFTEGNDNTINTVTTTQVDQPKDLEELVTFVRAVAQALPVLALEAEQRENARTLAVQILEDAEEPGVERGRLAALGTSLRALLTQAGGDALSTSLLSLWTP